MEEYLKEYREHIVKAEQKAQEDFDKTIIALSGGALGISFAFIKDIIGPDKISNSYLLFWAWLSWGISLASVLISYYMSHLALRKTIEQIDTNEIKDSPPGAVYDKITAICNAFGAICFLIGIVVMAIFVKLNL